MKKKILPQTWDKNHKFRQNWKKVVLGVLGIIAVLVVVSIVGVFAWMQTWKTYTSKERGFSIKYPLNWKATEDNTAMGDDPREPPLAIYSNDHNTTIYVSRNKYSSKFLKENNILSSKEYVEILTRRANAPIFSTAIDGKAAWWISFYDASNRMIYSDLSLDSGNKLLYNVESYSNRYELNSDQQGYTKIPIFNIVFNQVISFLIPHTFHLLK